MPAGTKTSPLRAQRFFSLFNGSTRRIIEAAKVIGPLMNRMDNLDNQTEEDKVQALLIELRKLQPPLKLDLTLFVAPLKTAGQQQGPLAMAKVLQNYFNCLEKNPKTFGLRLPEANEEFDGHEGHGFDSPLSDYPWFSQRDNATVLNEFINCLLKAPLADRQSGVSVLAWHKGNPLDHLKIRLDADKEKEFIKVVLPPPWHKGTKGRLLDRFIQRLIEDGTLPKIEIPPHLAHRFLPGYVGGQPDQIYEGPVQGVPEDRASRFRTSALDYYFHHGGNLPNYVLRDLGIRCGIVLTPQSQLDVWWKLLGLFELDDNKRGGAGKGKAVYSSRRKISEIDHKNPIVGQFQESIGGKDGYGIAWTKKGLNLYTEYQENATAYYELPDIHDSIASYPPYKTMRMLSLFGDFGRKTYHLDSKVVDAWTDEDEDAYDKSECARLGRSCGILDCEVKLETETEEDYGLPDRMFSSPDDINIPNCRSHFDRALINKEANISLKDTLAEFSLGHITGTNNDSLNAVSRRFAVIHSCPCGCGGYLGDHNKTDSGTNTLWSGVLLCSKSCTVRAKPAFKKLVIAATAVLKKNPNTSRLDLDVIKPISGATREEKCVDCGTPVRAVYGHLADDSENLNLRKVNAQGELLCTTCFTKGYRVNNNPLAPEYIPEYLAELLKSPTVLTLSNLSRRSRSIGEGRAMRLPARILGTLKTKGKDLVSPQVYSEFRIALQGLATGERGD